MKVILDTNVLISSLLFQGKTARVHNHCLLYADIYISDFILQELKINLTVKFKIKKAETDLIFQHLLATTQKVKPIGKIPDICRDKDDNQILFLAQSIQADFIITGDQDLLVLKEFRKTEIISPSDFASRFLQ